MATRMRLSQRHGIAIYTVANTAAARADDAPLIDPYSHISRLLFHSRFAYLSMPSLHITSVVLPARTGKGQVTYRPSGWPVKHGASTKGMVGVLLVGERLTAMTQLVLGEVHPKGLYGRSGWRRLYLSFVRGGAQLTEVWNGGTTTIKSTRLFIGYSLLVPNEGFAPGNIRMPCRIAPKLGILKIGAFDASKPWLRTTKDARRAFTVVKGVNVHASKGGAVRVVRANGSVMTLPGISGYTAPTPKPKRYAVAPR